MARVEFAVREQQGMTSLRYAESGAHVLAALTDVDVQLVHYFERLWTFGLAQWDRRSLFSVGRIAARPLSGLPQPIRTRPVLSALGHLAEVVSEAKRHAERNVNASHGRSSGRRRSVRPVAAGYDGFLARSRIHSSPSRQ